MPLCPVCSCGSPGVTGPRVLRTVLLIALGSGFEVCCDGPGDVDVAHGAGLETSQGDVVQMCYCAQTKLVQSGGLKKLQGKKVPG